MKIDIMQTLKKLGVQAKANDNVYESISKIVDESAYVCDTVLDADGVVLNMVCNPESLINCVEKACQNLLDALLIDTENDHNTKDTAKRMAKMYVTEVFKGRYTPRPTITTFDNVRNIDQMYTVGPATVRSTCAHHFVPIVGQVWYGVLLEKEGHVLGLSKFARLADWIFRRPQIQEEATAQLADIIEETLKPRGMAVVVRASHLCMTWRGVQDNDTSMITSDLRGVFQEDATIRAEFFNLIKAQGF